MVALSTDQRCDWSDTLTVLSWSEDRAPARPQLSLSEARPPLSSATYGRRVAVRRADGTVVIPGPDERGSV